MLDFMTSLFFMLWILCSPPLWATLCIIRCPSVRAHH